MIVRIGFAPGARVPRRQDFTTLVQGLEQLRFDSLWVTERVTGPAGDPIVLLSTAAALSQRIKLGTAVMTLPGRQPALLAQQLATLDWMSGGRLLPAFGLGQRDEGEQQAFGIQRTERVALLEEALPLLRRFWSGEAVTHEGPYFRYDGLRVRPQPASGGFDVWLGGTSDAELRRTGRLADGWLAAFTTPREAERGREMIESAAAEAGRQIDPEHFGAVVPYHRGPLGPEAETRFAKARRVHGLVALDDVVPSLEGLEAHLRRLIDAGLSKFVLAPVHHPADWTSELAEVKDAALVLQT